MVSEFAKKVRDPKYSAVYCAFVVIIVLTFGSCSNDVNLIKEVSVSTAMSKARELDGYYLAVYGHLHIRRTREGSTKFYLLPDPGWSSYLLLDEEIEYLSVNLQFSESAKYMQPSDHCADDFIVAFGRFSFAKKKATLIVGNGGAILSKSSEENFDCQNEQ